MRTCTNKNYALHDALPCGHYPLVDKRTNKCVACAHLEFFTEPMLTTGYGESFVDLGDGVRVVHEFTTQGVCERLLRARYGDRVAREVQIGHSRMRADIMLDGDTIVEFDGPSHYTSAKTIASDIKKDALCKQLGISVCRVPFFIQLDYITAEMLQITDKLYAETSFPHGWITSDAFPASFCEAGVTRFLNEFKSYQKGIQKVVLDSLLENEHFYAQEVVLTATQKEKLQAMYLAE